MGNLVDNDAGKCINDDHCLVKWSKKIIGKQITVGFFNHKYLFFSDTKGRIAINLNVRTEVKEKKKGRKRITQFSKFQIKYSKETVSDEKEVRHIIIN